MIHRAVNTADVAVQHSVTEVFVHQNPSSNSVVFPLVASLSNSDKQRWLTWITHRTPNREQLESLHAQFSNIRIIGIKPESDNRWLVWEALSQGNSHTVIADAKALCPQDIQQLEHAAHRGHSNAILIREVTQLQ